MTATADELLRGLDADQRLAVTHPPGPLAVEAGPGSGKTRVLTHRVAWRAATGTGDPGRTVVLTFTRKAAWELTERLAALGVPEVRAGTVHSVASQLLQQFWADHLLPRRPVARSPRRLMEAAVASLPGAPPVGVLLREAEWLGSQGLSPERYPERAGNRGQRADTGVVAAALRRYEEEKRRRGVVDLNDLLLHLARAAAEPATAAALHWRFRHVLVDEAQDLTPAQWAVVRALVGTDHDLCMVGDLNQAIYGWNGADPAILASMGEPYPGTNRIALRRNYRSLPEVIAAGDRLLERTEPTPAVRSGVGSVAVHEYPDEASEAAGVLRRIRAEQARGIPLTHMAVLARTNEALAPVERLLRSAELPFQSGRDLLAEPVVREVLRRLGSLPRRTPARSCLDDVAQVADEVLAEQAVSVAEPGVDRRSLATARDHLDRLQTLVAEWAEGAPGAPLGLLPEWLAAAVRSQGGDPGESRRGVELATFHRSKGLEFPVVFVIGLCEGLAPHASAGDLEEERRLVYVALTRAEERVYCSWTASRRVGARTAPARPSRFLATVDAGTTDPGRADPGGTDAGTTGPVPEDPARRVSDRIAEIRRLLKGA